MRKTTIQGVPPQYDDVVLKDKQDKAVSAFMSSVESKHRLQADIPAILFSELEKLINDGYSVAADLPCNLAPLSYSVYLVKPEHVLIEDVERVREQAKEDYILWLQSEHERYQALLVQQMVEKAERDEEEKQDKLKSKQLQAFKEKAKAVYTPLQIPS